MSDLAVSLWQDCDGYRIELSRLDDPDSSFTVDLSRDGLKELLGGIARFADEDDSYRQIIIEPQEYEE